jgi:dephospho-CoA kinase
MIIIGLTGSIGMGKSTTADMFRNRGIPVHDADAAVHALYEGPAVAAIAAAFPGTTRDGRVDRQKLGDAVIGNAKAFARLEAIIHPMVRDVETEFLKSARAQGQDVAILEIPLLFETGADKRCDATIVVTAPLRCAARPRPRASRHDRRKTRWDSRKADAGCGKAPKGRFSGGNPSWAGSRPHTGRRYSGNLARGWCRTYGVRHGNGRVSHAGSRAGYRNDGALISGRATGSWKSAVSN